MSTTGATRDPRLELVRGALVALLLSQVLSGLPALRSIHWVAPADSSWAWLAQLRPLEGLFVLSLGLVAGSVFGKTGRQHGLARCSGALLRRAATYYLAFVAVACLVAVARCWPRIETAALTQHLDATSGLMGSTYPGLDDRVSYQLFELMFLRAGPEQLQLLALCVLLLALAPLPAWALLNGHLRATLLTSGALAALAWFDAQARATAPVWLGLSFEAHYNLSLWQLPFVAAFALGWQRPHWQPWAQQRRGLLLLGTTATLLAEACALALVGPPPPGVPPAGADVALLLACGLPLLAALHALLGFAWLPLRRSVGRLLLPIGQEPLAVFVLHGLWLLLFLQLPPLPPLAAAAALAASWLFTWAIVRSRAGLRWIPH